MNIFVLIWIINIVNLGIIDIVNLGNKVENFFFKNIREEYFVYGKFLEREGWLYLLVSF